MRQYLKCGLSPDPEAIVYRYILEAVDVTGRGLGNITPVGLRLKSPRLSLQGETKFCRAWLGELIYLSEF